MNSIKNMNTTLKKKTEEKSLFPALNTVRGPVNKLMAAF